MGRPYHVFDNDGEYLGSFGSWDTAHDWAHLQTAVGATPGPLEIEDRRTGTVRQVWADRCELVPRSEARASTGRDPIAMACLDSELDWAAAVSVAPPAPRRPTG